MNASLKTQFEMLAAYNAWANERLYAAAALFSDADYRADRGAFFGSLHGTLNHLLLGDRIWMHRFTGEGEEPAELEAILYDDLAELRAARRVEDVCIAGYVSALSEPDLAGTVRYCTTRNPTQIEQGLAHLLTHFFNHQTHHRGQAHGIITGLAGEAPSLDLLIFQRETGTGLVRGQGGDFSQPERRPAVFGHTASGTRSAKREKGVARRQVPVTSSWGEAIGYSRAVRVGDLVFVSGTTASGPDGTALYPNDAGRQAETIIERIALALQ
jgi:uncharacterized damage-inducible protein DinB